MSDTMATRLQTWDRLKGHTHARMTVQVRATNSICMYIYRFSVVATQIICVRPRGNPWLSARNSHGILRKNVSFPRHVLYLYYQIEPTNSFSKAEAAEVDLGVVRKTPCLKTKVGLVTRSSWRLYLCNTVFWWPLFELQISPILVCV